MNLKISRCEGELLRDEWTTKPFTKNPGFNDSWWLDRAKGPLLFFTFAADHEGEVARAEVNPRSTVGMAYPAFAQLESTEIQLLEVRADLRGRGLGHSAVDLLHVEYPARFVALSLNARSDRFWRSLGWTEHVPPNERGAALFAEPD